MLKVGKIIQLTEKDFEHDIVFKMPPKNAYKLKCGGCERLEQKNKKLREALEFARAAIEDAITLEDGLNGSTGEDILKLIKQSIGETIDKRYDARYFSYLFLIFRKPKCPGCGVKMRDVETPFEPHWKCPKCGWITFYKHKDK